MNGLDVVTASRRPRHKGAFAGCDADPWWRQADEDPRVVHNGMNGRFNGGEARGLPLSGSIFGRRRELYLSRLQIISAPITLPHCWHHVQRAAVSGPSISRESFKDHEHVRSAMGFLQSHVFHETWELGRERRS